MIISTINAFRRTASAGVIGTIDRQHLVIPVVLARKTLTILSTERPG